MSAPLDEPALYAVDSLGLIAGMGTSVAAFDEAREGAETVDLRWQPGMFRNVAICALGGSAIAGDIVVSSWHERLRVPVEVLRDYYIPGWLGEETLVILSSYSGDTEETLTMAHQAIENMAPCVAITSGGKLGGAYRAMGVPVIDLAPGYQPRAALLRMLVPQIVVLERLGIIAEAGRDLDDARACIARAVSEWGPDVPTAENHAKQVAEALHRTVPIIWGAEATAGVARRFKGQINENAKIPAYWGLVPEVNHNEICGFEGMGSFAELARLVLLREPRQHRQVARRFTFAAEIVEKDVGGIIELEGRGQTPLGSAIDLVMLTDYISLYMAVLRGVDPGPVHAIGALKDRLSSLES